MGNVDSVPVVSQLKSAVQAIGGDLEGAERTQQNFVKVLDRMPVASQIKSAVQAIAGDEEGARRTQETFLNSTPVVGHIKGAVHLACGDEEGANEAFRSATIGVAKLATGGVGALAITVAESAAYD